MHLLFCHDKFYIRGNDGKVYSYGSFPYHLWESRFLPHFESMTVVGIKKKRTAEETGVLEVSSGRNVEHILLPNIHAPFKRLIQSQRIFRKIREQVVKADAVVVRGPVDFGIMAARAARSLGKPYAVEMTSCAYDSNYFNGSMLGKAYASLAYRMTREMVLHADAVMYATEHFLQSRYPTQGISAFAPNVEIAAAPEFVLSQRLERLEENKDAPVTIGIIGNLMGGFRGLDVAFEALGIVKKMESIPEFKLRILGQGFAPQWQETIRSYDLDGHIEFCGSMPRGQAVLEWLDGIDLYLQPSPHQGLPRPMIEAMSRGCAVLASDAGGAPELIDGHFVHPRGDAPALAAHIVEMLQNGHRAEQAKRNFKKAKTYSNEFLAPRRLQFWSDFSDLARERKNAGFKKKA